MSLHFTEYTTNMKSIFLPFLVVFPCFAHAQTMDTIAATRLVDSLVLVSRNLANERDFEKAIAINEAAEKTALLQLGRKSAAYGNACFNHGRILHLKSDFQNAEQWYLNSREIQEKTLGKMNPNYATTLNNLGALYISMGQYEKVGPLYQEALAIREQLLGKEDPAYLSSLNNLAIFYKDTGKTELAEPLFIDSKELRGKVFGKEHPKYASSLEGLGVLYLETGRYEQAEQLLITAKTIREKVQGRSHPDYFSCLTNLAVLNMETGRYEKAEPLYLEAKNLMEQTLAKGDPNYSKSLNNLANLYLQLGEYEKVEPLYKKALANLESSSGNENPDYARYLNNLATFYFTIGDLDKAEAIFLEVNVIREHTLGKAHPDYATSLGNLASLYKRLNQFSKALPLYQEVKSIYENSEKKNEKLYALNLENLSSLYLNTGELKKAETLALDAVSRLDKLLGKAHPDYAKSLYILADVQKAKGQTVQAEALYHEALSIYDKSLGKLNTDYKDCLFNLIGLHQSLGNYEKAGPLARELSDLTQAIISRGIFYLSELELNKYLLSFSDNQNLLLSLAEDTANKDTRNVGTCYDNILFIKGFLLQSINQVKRMAMSDTAATQKLLLLKSYERRLASEYAKAKAERIGVAELEAHANDLEKDIARSVSNFGEAMRQVTWREVQQKLKPGEAAIEFVQYQYFGKKQTDSTMYVALLLRPGMKQPQFVPLFEEKSLDSLLHTQGQRKADYVNSLYAVAERGARPLNKPEKSLYEMLWQPLEQSTQASRGGVGLLDGVQTIYFSPVGLLHRLNVGAIPITEEETVADRYDLVELGSTRQLAMPSGTFLPNQDAVLFGGIKYETESIALQQEKEDYSDKFELKPGQLSTKNIDATLRGGSWNYLKWTDREVTALAPILETSDFQTTTLRGEDATESAFKTIGSSGASPRVLHIATHGFFFPDPPPQPSKKGADPNAASGIGGINASEPVFKMSEHPMIRSGLILAGGNFAWENGRPVAPGMEDGILTAYEISQMNLANTELVALSACETGLGDIQGNEGVYGLQRAFKIAGVKYLIMSLWQIPDFQTQELMTTFYTKWLSEKMTIPNAFRAAQKEMREKYQNPFFWAGFVLVE